jgi:GNAT superfamily N-acetyltransferase
MEIQPLIDFAQGYEQYPINAWIELPAFKLRLYTRRAKRYLGESRVETLDLASFEIPERYRGKGLFTRFIALVESYATELGLVVFVECVHNERLRAFLERRGYMPAEGQCYWKGV